MSVKKTKVPTKGELFMLGRMDLLKIIKQLRDEIYQLRLAIRAKNVTVREERMTKRMHWDKIKRYRELVGPLSKLEPMKE